MTTTTTTVGPKHVQGSYPIKKQYNRKTDADELVVFQDAQALPVFLVYMNSKHKGNTQSKPDSSLFSRKNKTKKHNQSTPNDDSFQFDLVPGALHSS